MRGEQIKTSPSNEKERYISFMQYHVYHAIKLGKVPE